MGELHNSNLPTGVKNPLARFVSYGWKHSVEDGEGFPLEIDSMKSLLRYVFYRRIAVRNIGENGIELIGKFLNSDQKSEVERLQVELLKWSEASIVDIGRIEALEAALKEVCETDFTDWYWWTHDPESPRVRAIKLLHKLHEPSPK